MMRYVFAGSIFMILMLSGCVEVHSENTDTEDEEGQHAEIGEMMTQDSILGLRGITLENIEAKENTGGEVTLYAEFSIENLSDDEIAHYEMGYRDVSIFSEDPDVKFNNFYADESIDFNRTREMEPGERLSGGFLFEGVTLSDDADYTITYNFGMFAKNTLVWEFNNSEIEEHGN